MPVLVWRNMLCIFYARWRRHILGASFQDVKNLLAVWPKRRFMLQTARYEVLNLHWTLFGNSGHRHCQLRQKTTFSHRLNEKWLLHKTHHDDWCLSAKSTFKIYPLFGVSTHVPPFLSPGHRMHRKRPKNFQPKLPKPCAMIAKRQKYSMTCIGFSWFFCCMRCTFPIPLSLTE